jgi:hypothetical protein
MWKSKSTGNSSVSQSARSSSTPSQVLRFSGSSAEEHVVPDATQSFYRRALVIVLWLVAMAILGYWYSIDESGQAWRGLLGVGIVITMVLGYVFYQNIDWEDDPDDPIT